MSGVSFSAEVASYGEVLITEGPRVRDLEVECAEAVTMLRKRFNYCV